MRADEGENRATCAFCRLTELENLTMPADASMMRKVLQHVIAVEFDLEGVTVGPSLIIRDALSEF